jgi:hypothetical protein
VASLSTIRKKLVLPGKAKGGGSDRHHHFGIEEISIADSLCSGVLRDAAAFSKKYRSKVPGENFFESSTATTTTSTETDDHPPSRTTIPISPKAEAFSSTPGADTMNSNNSYDDMEHPTTPPSPHHHHHHNNRDTTFEAASISREERKERVKEKLEKYKRNQKQLKIACMALEQQLAQTTAKLREVDTNASFKIESLESELRETKGGLERISSQSHREVADQSECIKTLGSKLIRQAHVIQRQKAAVSQYKMQLEAMAEEMAMQDERDSRLEEEMQLLTEELEKTKTSKAQMQSRLQHTLEEMMDLKSESEMDAKYKVDLEFRLQQQEAMMDRLAHDMATKTRKISELEDEIESKNWEVETMKEKLRESEKTLEGVQCELESALKRATAAEAAAGAGENGRGRSIGEDTGDDDNSKSDNNITYLSSNGARSPSASPVKSPSSASSAVGPRPSWKRILAPPPFPVAAASAAEDDNGNNDEDPNGDSPETFESQLQAKDAVISTLNETCQDHELTISTLRSDMVKMSSTYKQDSYLKRKEIAKLKQQNAEYALKLRALEKAFKCVNATENMPVVGTKFHGHTTHGGESGGGGVVGEVGGGGGGGSLHGMPAHSMGALSGNQHSKNNKLAAVKSRIGALYDFPSPRDIKKDSMIVQQANFFDGGSDGSDLDGKGENPEEC